VIIYDEGGIVDAARVFWTLEVYGLTQVQILDRGYKYWRSKNFLTSQETPRIKPSQYIATINHKRLASKFATQLATQNKNKVVIDARSVPAYLGKTSVAKRFGHIPSAISVPFEQNITQNSEFAGLKPLNELKSLYADIPVGKRVIIYCKIGRVSSTNYFALRELGYDVANYDASWREWGNDESLPIEK
jgi:thiosulfate/3-mercaptopyruvate sulfurtransferase